MVPRGSTLTVLIGLFALSLAGRSAAQPASSPLVVAKPTWSKVVPMPDGRMFVSDGGLAVDAKLAQPATMPSVVLPANTGKLLAGHVTAPFDAECGLGDLRPGERANTFMTPSGVALNGNYVTFLRSVAPSARTRVRTRGKTDPIIVMTDGQAVAILMPLAPLK